MTDVEGVEGGANATTEKADAPRPWWVSLARGVLVRVTALVLFMFVWQVIVWTGVKAQYQLPSPITVLDHMLRSPGAFTTDIGVTMARAAIGIGVAIVVGVVTGVAASLVPYLREPVRSICKGLHTMPIVVWIPFTVVVIGLQDADLLFVFVVAAAPPIAVGVIDGIGPVHWSKAKREGAPRTPNVLARALPDTVAGIRTGWLSGWAVLLAGEVLLTLTSLGLGGRVVFDIGLNEPVAAYELLLVIFILGVVIDGVVFGALTALVRPRETPTT